MQPHEPTHRDREIFQSACMLCRESGYAKRPVRLLGIGLSGWEPESHRQPELFGESPHVEREERLYTTLDQVSARFGKGTVRFGLQSNKPPTGP